MKLIGSVKRFAEDLFRNFGITPFREILKPEDFEDCARKCRRPVRKRAAPPEVITWLMMFAALITDSFATALARGWIQMKNVFAELPARVITAQAFAEGRKMLPVAFFQSLFSLLGERFAKAHQRALSWKGFRVLAGDGSVLTLPESKPLRAHFGCPSNQRTKRCRIQARLVAIVSIFTGFCSGFVLAPFASSEQKLLAQILSSIGRGDLLLLDRGFFGFGMLHAVINQGAQVLMRIQKHVRPAKIQKLANGVVLWTIRTNARQRRNWPGLPAEMTLRHVRYAPHGSRPILLLTSLTDPKIASDQEIADLYHFRWRIETVYRELKHVLDMQGLRSHTPEGILKEVHCHLLLNNLIRWLMQEAAEKQRGQDGLAIDYSFKGAYHAVIEYAPKMLYYEDKYLRILYEQLLASISAHPIDKRPGRSYPRATDRGEYAKRRRAARLKYKKPA
jgi:hypothetical protein